MKEPKNKDNQTMTKETKGMERNLMYRINKGLSIVSTEVVHHPKLDLARHDHFNKRDKFSRGGSGTADQTCAGWRAGTREDERI